MTFYIVIHHYTFHYVLLHTLGVYLDEFMHRESFKTVYDENDTQIVYMSVLSIVGKSWISYELET